MTTTETTPRINALTGIHIDKIDRNRIIAALKEHNRDVDGSDSTQQLAVQLFGVFKDLSYKDKVRCTQCKGVANKELDVCPFCGHDEGDDLPEPGASVGETKEEAQMTTTEEKPKKKKKKEHAETNGAAVAAVPDDLQASSSLRTERELDQAVANVEKLKVDSAGSYWQMGHQIAEIHTLGLWKLRVEVNEKGKTKARWSTWEAFCNAELKMTPKSANAVMDVAKGFTEDQVRLWGRSKLNLVLQAPPETRAAILEKVTTGASKREIEKEVRKGKADAGYTRPSRGVRGGKTSATQKQKGTKQIVVANILGLQTVKCYKKPASLKNVDWKEQPRAKKIGDVPIGVLQLANDVSMFITMTESAGGELQYKVQTLRDEEE